MEKKLATVRKWLILDALVLLALSVYEVISRIDAMWGPLKMFFNMAVGENIPLDRVVTYVDMRIFEVPGYMILCGLLSLLTLLTIKTRRGSMVLLPASVVLAVWGAFVQMSLIGEIFRYVKVLPLIVMSVLFVCHIVLVQRNLRLLRLRARRVGYTAGYSPIQPQHMEGRRFQYGIGDHPNRLPRRRRVS